MLVKQTVHTLKRFISSGMRATQTKHAIRMKDGRIPVFSTYGKARNFLDVVRPDNPKAFVAKVYIHKEEIKLTKKHVLDPTPEAM